MSNDTKKRKFEIILDANDCVGKQSVTVEATDGPFIGVYGELFFKGNSAYFHGDKWISCVEVG